MPFPRVIATLAGALSIALAAPAAAHALSGSDLRVSLSDAMGDARAAHTGAYVKDLDTGDVLFARNAGSARIPASVEKLYTTAAALRSLGPSARIVTRLYATGPVRDGRLDGDLLIVGAGDPTLDGEAIARLARAARRAGIERVSGSVLGDESYFDRLRGGPRTGGAWDSDVGGVLGALTVDRGFSREGDPALAAARRLVKALRARKVTVLGRTATGRLPAKGARSVARVRSATVAQLARRTNTPSDNFFAEMLLKGIGAAKARPGTTGRGVAVARDELSSLGVAPAMADGSGLSRANRTSARQVVRLLEAMRTTPQRDAFEASLAVAGRSGTLAGRLRGTSAAGACRGKTGTLNRVSALAGLCRTREGHTVAFALLMNGVDVFRARGQQDRAALAITNYVSRPLVGRLPRD